LFSEVTVENNTHLQHVQFRFMRKWDATLSFTHIYLKIGVWVCSMVLRNLSKLRNERTFLLFVSKHLFHYRFEKHKQRSKKYNASPEKIKDSCNWHTCN